jgi:hypothetical protein
MLWTSNPTSLFRINSIGSFVPNGAMPDDVRMNSITRTILILTIIAFIVSSEDKKYTVLASGCISIVLIAFLYNKRAAAAPTVEGMSGLHPENVPSFIPPSAPQQPTRPTDRNPAMNVMLTDIVDNPMRGPAEMAYEPQVEKEMNAAVKRLPGINMEFANDGNVVPDLDKRLFQDVGDNSDFEASMRTFQPTPNTQIPNDQGGFANFCYGDMLSCKTGDGVACMRNNGRHINY